MILAAIAHRTVLLRRILAKPGTAWYGQPPDYTDKTHLYPLINKVEFTTGMYDGS